MLFNGADIVALTERLASDGTPAERRRHDLLIQVIEPIQFALFQQADRVLNDCGIYTLALCRQRAQMAQDIVCAVHRVLAFALHDDISAAERNAHTHQFFKQADVFIPCAEQGLQSLRFRGIFSFFRQKQILQCLFQGSI